MGHRSFLSVGSVAARFLRKGYSTLIYILRFLCDVSSEVVCCVW